MKPAAIIIAAAILAATFAVMQRYQPLSGPGGVWVLDAFRGEVLQCGVMLEDVTRRCYEAGTVRDVRAVPIR